MKGQLDFTTLALDNIQISVSAFIVVCLVLFSSCKEEQKIFLQPELP